MEAPRRLPVILLTGFLGSGKTSLLLHVLGAEGYPRERTAVLVNDFGSVNVDAALVETRAKVARIAALTGGCLCCAGATEMGNDLLALADDPGIDRAWIEASGVAETDDLLDRLTDRRLLRRVAVERVVHVVDASAYPGWWTNRTLAREQLRWADVIVVNKIDAAKPKALEKIREDIAQFNPKARVTEAVRGAVDLSGVTEGQGPSAASRPRATARGTGAPHAEPTTTVFLPLARPVSRDGLGRRLADAPGEVYRAKGFVCFDDDPGQLCLFQKAGEQSEVVVWKAAEEAAGEFPRGLVLLGRGLDSARLASHFEALV